MRKIEYIWRELLIKTIDLRQPEFTLTELADRFHLSTSMVSHALVPLRELKMVKIGKIRSEIVDVERLLYFWATRRNYQKDLIYQTYSPESISEIEASMPGNMIPTAYTACMQLFQIQPADYAVVYYYSSDKNEIVKRFPPNSRHPANIFIMKPDPFLQKSKTISQAQVFADLWNLPEWFSRDFRQILLEKIYIKLGL